MLSRLCHFSSPYLLLSISIYEIQHRGCWLFYGTSLFLCTGNAFKIDHTTTDIYINQTRPGVPSISRTHEIYSVCGIQKEILVGSSQELSDPKISRSHGAVFCEKYSLCSYCGKRCMKLTHGLVLNRRIYIFIFIYTVYIYTV